MARSPISGQITVYWCLDSHVNVHRVICCCIPTWYDHTKWFLGFLNGWLNHQQAALSFFQLQMASVFCFLKSSSQSNVLRLYFLGFHMFETTPVLIHCYNIVLNPLKKLVFMISWWLIHHFQNFLGKLLICLAPLVGYVEIPHRWHYLRLPKVDMENQASTDQKVSTGIFNMSVYLGSNRFVLHGYDCQFLGVKP